VATTEEKTGFWRARKRVRHRELLPQTRREERRNCEARAGTESKRSAQEKTKKIVLSKETLTKVAGSIRKGGREKEPRGTTKITNWGPAPPLFDARPQGHNKERYLEWWHHHVRRQGKGDNGELPHDRAVQKNSNT